MREVAALVGAICALCILAFNPQLVSGVYNMAMSPIEQWKKNPDDISKSAGGLVLEAPNFPTNEAGEVPAAEYMRSDAPSGNGGGSGGRVYGGRAVAIQRADGL